MAKWALESKTIWTAVIAEAIALLETYGKTDLLDPHTLAIVLPILFMLLRLITNQPVTVTPPADNASLLRSHQQQE